MEQQIQLNDHNKQEYPPMHTAEHLLSLQWTGFVPLSDMTKVYNHICSFFFRCGHCENAGSQRFLPWLH